MFRPRVIPVLLLKKNILVKSKRFKDFTYIGDAINAVRIFSTLKADELILLDIDATTRGDMISPSLIREIGEETNMPFSVGGGIKTISQIKEAIAAGAEKVVIGSEAARRPLFIKEAADTFGSSTIAVCIDVKTAFLGKQKVWISNGKKNTGLDPLEFAKEMERMGAGEIIIQSISADGSMRGYDLQLTSSVSGLVTIPVVALGGAGNFSHFSQAYRSGASALAAGSLFVFHGNNRGVLINYPSHTEISFLK